ncbi:MAG: hypothetical protein D6713_02690 [Deltaproteobacteria bacterium]|nr:MAG: hypothetical protein D6713_02690 [Deltaproteobacteria bacterium]
MKKRDLHFLMMVVLVVGLLVVLSLTGKPRYLPTDEAHMTATTDAQCLACHGEEAENPIQKMEKHPPKYRKCYLCHRKKKG